ncbi:MAG: hypothetical protein ABIG96_02855 [Candidatus Micrarchaeota archaeon]
MKRKSRAGRKEKAVPAERDVRWDEAMRLGLAGMVATFLARTFYDTYLLGEIPDYNFALYHGIIFGAVVALVWKFWPWKRG